MCSTRVITIFSLSSPPDAVDPPPYPSASQAYFDVVMFTKGPSKARLLIIDTTSNSLIRRNPSNPSAAPHVYPVNDRVRVERHVSDPCRVKVTCDDGDSFEYLFGGPAALAKFTGGLHALMLDVDPSMVRGDTLSYSRALSRFRSSCSGDVWSCESRGRGCSSTGWSCAWAGFLSGCACPLAVCPGCDRAGRTDISNFIVVLCLVCMGVCLDREGGLTA